MAFEDAIISSAISAILGFFLGLYSQRWNMRRSTNESTKERVYSPLFDEIEDGLDRLKRGDSVQMTQWRKITDETHLSYLIEPPELDHKLREFYGDTGKELNTWVGACQNRYHDLVRSDLLARMPPAKVNSTSSPAITEVSRAVGWNLHKDSLYEGSIPFFNSQYDILAPELGGTFKEYFESLKEKSKDDDVMKGYRKARHKALTQANELRKMLAKKLGKKIE